jgi:type I restriction enzyme M protein
MVVNMNTRIVKEYLDNQKIKVVEKYDFSNRTISYSKDIKQYREIKTISGDEEVVRAYILAKLVNELEYKAENIEIEKEYQAGRPKKIKPRIDMILKDSEGNPFLFLEAKSPEKFEADKDLIEDQLFGLASLETGKYGTEIKYLVYYSIEITENGKILDNAIIINYKKYPIYEVWESSGYPSVGNKLPARYEKAQKEPFKKGVKNLEKDLSFEKIDAVRKNLHNVLWGGGSVGDNEIFSSLVNIILAKIQDEEEKENGQVYDFQVFSYGKNGEELEDAEKVFDRVNKLYRRSLKQKLNIEDRKAEKANIINEEKFPLNKLLYTIQQLERYSFKEAGNNLNGKDILGSFFEGIIRQGFRQTKGQFLTPINIVKFILYTLKIDSVAIDKLNNKLTLPYIIDPAVGSGTFLIEAMKMITQKVKYQRKNELKDSENIKEEFHALFMPAFRENKWARTYLYGIENNFDLGTATKVNMILHGDGSSNVFIKDGLLPFRFYTKETAPNLLDKTKSNPFYYNKDINGKFDILISNPPFSVNLERETKRYLKDSFLFSNKKNSENLFIERWYQLLKPNGRMGVVLPESVFDTTENKYIRLFIYKYFKVKAVVSLPQLAFEPFTSTKTSLLFAQKKTKEEIRKWNTLWRKYSNEWSKLKVRVENLIAVCLDGKDREKLPSIKDLTEKEEKEILLRMLKDYIEDGDKKLSSKETINKYTDELKDLCRYDNATIDVFGFVNTWWVFGEIAKELNYKIFMAEAENVGYKRTKRGEKPMPNDLLNIRKNGEILIDVNNPKTILDYIERANIWQ